MLQTTEQEPYGWMINRINNNRIDYTGHVMDQAADLIYMQQRYYDPLTPRFLSVDPITAYSNPVGAFNRYWYANNNPYRFTDPDGRRACGKDTTCALEQGARGGVAFNRNTVESTGGAQAQQQLRTTNTYVDPGPRGTQQMSREFELSKPSPNGGYIVQEMTIQVTFTKPQMTSASTTYFEAFEVPAGGSGPFPARDVFAVNPPPGSSGTAKWNGIARFYEGLELPATFAPGNVIHAGSLPATFVRPNLDAENATNSVNIMFETSWP